MPERTQTADFRFDVAAEWESPPPNIQHKDVAGVGVDSADYVYLFTRYDPAVLVYGRDGSFMTSWGHGLFNNPHGLTIGPDDSVYCVDNGDHTVRKFTSTGDVLLTLGTAGQPSHTGRKTGVPFVIHNVETVEHPGPPFNACTNIAVAPSGDLYVADGYGNCRIHQFSAAGELIRSWGEIGVGPGQFHLPHGIAVDADERVYVCDRENDRIQLFTPTGDYLCEWTDVQRPTNLVIDPGGYVYVAELWRQRGKGSFVHGLMKEDHPGRVTIFDRNGYIVARWGASTVSRGASGNFIAPHDIAIDSHGDVYVAEVTYTFGIKQCGLGPEFADHQIQKFVRQ